MRSRSAPTLSTLILLVAAWALQPAEAQRARYLQYVEEAAEHEWARYPEVIASWKANVNPSVLWGYDAPAQPVYLADVLGFLYEETGDESYARRAATILAEYGDLRDAYPEDYAETRAEYENGIPSLANFFFLPPYSRAYLRIRESPALEPAAQEKIERDLAHSLDFVFHFPEWGAHNRALLRAEGLYFGYLALPDHPSAPRWKQMAEIIARDNLNEWEVEDASLYSAVWLRSLFSYAEIAGREDVLDGPILRYNAEYFKRLVTPLGTIPDYGDSNWDPMGDYFVAVFEKMAARYADPELKWIADRLYDRVMERGGSRTVGTASNFMHAYQWADDDLGARRPESLSQEVLDDVIGKKVVFRDGWSPDDTYLLLNYRDEGDGGFAHREFLRNTLSVEEEKMHHGHSDENSVIMLVQDGSVLLHDGGYRDDLPSGPFGAYRADYFHNRIVVRKNMRDRHQEIADFIRDSGAYRPVRTHKVDYLSFDDVDVSRTRLIDDAIGYEWDRIITYLRDEGFFVVVDAVKATVTDFYTFTNLWHTQTVHERAAWRYETSIDSIGSVALPQKRRLLIAFLENDAKQDGTYPENRHFQNEIAIYQTQSSHYRAGDYELFITALIPKEPGRAAAELVDRLEVIRPESFPEAVGVSIAIGERTTYLGFKIDLESELVRENIRPRYTWEEGRTRYGDLETDAHFLYASVGENDIRYAASQVLKVIYGDQVLMEALPNTHGLQLDGAPDRVGYVKWRAWEDAVDLR